MANEISTKSPLSPAVIVTAIVIVVLILGFFGWKTLGGGAGSERVPIDINKVKENIKQNGIGHH